LFHQKKYQKKQTDRKQTPLRILKISFLQYNNIHQLSSIPSSPLLSFQKSQEKQLERSLSNELTTSVNSAAMLSFGVKHDVTDASLDRIKSIPK